MNSECKPGDELVLRRYLLGELSEEELVRVEERLFSEEDYADQISLVEDDLIDSYVHDEIQGRERDDFESHFLSSPRRRERVAHARTWLGSVPVSGKAQRQSRFRDRIAVRLGASPLAAFRNWHFGSWVVVPMAAALLMVFATGLLIRATLEIGQQRYESATLRKQVEELHREMASKPLAAQAPARDDLIAELRAEIPKMMRPAGSAPEAPLSYILAPGVQRGSAQSEQRLILPAGDRSLTLLLMVTDSTPYSSYRVMIQDLDGNEVWGSNRLLASKDPAGLTLKLTVPSAVLKPGDYKALVTGVRSSGGDDDVNDYYLFRVVR